jgi:FKBP-type peptidyl-prolyl cis-trans isomerase
MARKRERTFAAFGAILFLVTSSALTIAVIISLIQQHKSNSNNPSSTTSSNSSSSTSKTSSTKLEGTKLQNFTPIASIPTLQTKDLVVGKGAAVAKGGSVTVNYTGAVAATGVIFQSSLDTGQPASFSLSQVIQGWQQGIPGMKVGGTRQLLIPAALAYGANPPSGAGIPANADLVFNVTLLKIN